MNAIEDLIRLLKHLPGMGEKSASRLAYHLIKTDDSFNKALGGAIMQIKDRIHPCPICGCYTEEEICGYCSSPDRDRTLLCVVEEPQDVLSIASSGAYNGLFHVLGGAIDPLSGIGPDVLSFLTYISLSPVFSDIHRPDRSLLSCSDCSSSILFRPEVRTVPSRHRFSARRKALPFSLHQVYSCSGYEGAA